MLDNKKLYKVKSSETLWDIAERELGDATRWKEITKAKDKSNFTKEEAKKIQIGEELYIPKKEVESNSIKISEDREEDNTKEKNKSNRVTHKEFLTFSNLTNLEWQFTDLEKLKEAEEKNELNYFLSKPESFVRKNTEGEIEEYPYIEGVKKEKNITKKDVEKGLAQMRSKAGIAMEYLEKEKEGNSEGSFLKNWEVIYGADNYEIVKDFYDDLYEVMCKNDPSLDPDKKPYDSRAKVEAAEDSITKLECISKGISIASKIVPRAIEFKFADETLEFKAFNESDKILNELTSAAAGKFLSTVKIDQLENSIENGIAMLDGSRKHWSLALFNYPAKLIGEVAKGKTKQYKADLEKKFDQDAIKETNLYKDNQQLDAGKIRFIKKLNMKDTGFRVVAFKNNDEIVIAYKKKDDKSKKLLPTELDLLKLAYAKISFEHEDCNIRFVGYNNGAELAYLGSLMYDKPATLFFPETPEVKGYVNCTYKDLNKDYKTNTEIKVEGFSNLVTKGSEEIIAGYLLSQGIVPGLLFLIGTEAMSSFFQYLDSKSIEALYNKLKESGYIEKEFSYNTHSLSKTAKEIKGYITDKVANEEVIKFELDTGEIIKVKLEDGIFIWHQKIGGADVRIPNSLRQDKNKVTFLTHGPNYELKKNNGVYELTSVIYSNESEYLLKSSYPDLNFKEFYDSSYKYALPNRPNLVYGKANFDNSFVKHRGRFILDILKIISQLQQSYIGKQSKNQYLVLNSKAETESEKVKIFAALPKKSEKETNNETIVTHNEFTFMPYIEKDGNISKTNPQLRDEYIVSVFKSMMQKHKEIKEHGFYRSIKPMIANNKRAMSKAEVKIKEKISEVKYGLEEYEDKYWHDFVNGFEDLIDKKVKIDEKFFQTIKKVKCRGNENSYDNAKLKTTVFFNYHKIILEKIKDNPQILEKYYKIEKAEQNKPFEDATHKIIIHPNYKSKLEYKYNRSDEIIGGDLKLYVKVEEETEDELVVSPTPQSKSKQATSKQEDKEKEKFTAETDESSPGTKFREKRKLVRGLNKKSSVEEIKEAAQIVASEARRKRKPVIAESLEDYLSGMYTKKRVNPKKLRTLDAIKTAEVELKLKLDEKLNWELNDIIRYKNEFKPFQEVYFETRDSRLVKPVCRSIEEFINASKKSILKTKANFVLEKVPDRRELALKGKLSYEWQNNYIWRVGRKKQLHNYGFIDDYLLKKLATRGSARPYKMYSKWSYYLEDRLSLLKDDVDTMRSWSWNSFSMFEYI